LIDGREDLLKLLVISGGAGERFDGQVRGFLGSPPLTLSPLSLLSSINEHNGSSIAPHTRHRLTASLIIIYGTGNESRRKIKAQAREMGINESNVVIIASLLLA